MIILIGVSNWTNKGEIMYVSRLKRWYSVNNMNNRQWIHMKKVQFQLLSTCCLNRLVQQNIVSIHNRFCSQVIMVTQQL